MALADELLDSISEEQFAEYMLVEENPHIVIDEDRNIILPERYKIIAAQGDHDMATYTFDCPRFSDGRDMSKMVVYINYIRSDGETGSYPADNVSIDAQDNDLMHFEWTPLLPATLEHGAFAFLVCVCRAEPDGSIKNHWSTRLCKDATISEGMDCHKDTIINMYPDVITRILERLNVLEDGGTTSVQYTVQDLEEEQKVQARKNIEAADAKEVSKLSEDIATKASAIKEKASGETIVVTDSDEAKPLGLAIDGKSEQNQYSGNNVLKPLGTFTKSGIDINTVNGFNVFDGTCTAQTDYYIIGDQGVYENIDIESGDYIVFSDEIPDGVTFYIVKDTTQVIAQLTKDNQSAVLTIDNSRSYRIFYRIATGAVFSNKSIKMMMNLGSEPLPIEPYVGGQPSPSTEYQQEIRNIGVYDEASGKYAVEVGCARKNLYNPNDKTSSNKTVVDENGVIEVVHDVTVQSGGISWVNCNIKPSNYLKKNTQYAVIVEIFSVENVSELQIATDATVSEMGQFAGYFTLSNPSVGIYKTVIRTRADFEDCVTFGRSYVGVTKGLFGKIKYRVSVFEDTSVSTENFVYKPFEETTATVLLDEPLRGIPVSSGGNYTDSNGQQWICDEIVKYADGSGEHIQRVEEKILDGTENIKWTVEINEFSTIIYFNAKELIENHDKSKIRDTNILCNHLIGGITYSPNVGKIMIDKNWLNTSFPAGIITTSDEMNEWLKNNNLEFVYILETPIRTPLTAEQIAEIEKLSMFYPTTILSNDCNANMEVTYIADTKAYIDKKFAELATAMV